MQDKIAVLLATYNGERYIKELLDSLLNQTYDNFVCYIHDDGSTDNTTTILNMYKENYHNKFVIINGEPSGNAKNNFMFLLEQINVKYTFFCDQDDVWEPTKIEDSVKKMIKIDEVTKPALIFSDMKVVSEDLSVISDSFIRYMKYNTEDLSFNRLITKNVAAGCTILINNCLRDLALQCHNINNISMHDWFFLLIASAYGTIAYLDKPLVLYRQHDNNVEGAKQKFGYTQYKLIMKRLLTHKQIQATKDGTNRVLLQAKEVLLLNQEDRLKTPLFEGVLNYTKKNKVERIIFLIKEGIVKPNLRQFFKLILA